MARSLVFGSWLLDDINTDPYDKKPILQKPTHMRNFRNLEVWHESIQLVKTIYEFTKNKGLKNDFSLKSQMQRSVVSIPSNIAEGASRDSSVEFSRFLQISLGSAFELETQMIIAHELELIETKLFNVTVEKLHVLQKRLNVLNQKVKTKDKRSITKTQRPKTKDQRPKTRDQRPETKDQRPKTKD